MSYVLIALNDHGLKEDYPELFEQAERVDKGGKTGFFVTKAEAELVDMMHELWLSRANKRKA